LRAVVGAVAVRVELFADEAVVDVVGVVHLAGEDVGGCVVLHVGEAVVEVPGVGRVRPAGNRRFAGQVSFVVVLVVVRPVGGDFVVRPGGVAGVGSVPVRVVRIAFVRLVRVGGGGFLAGRVVRKTVAAVGRAGAREVTRSREKDLSRSASFLPVRRCAPLSGRTSQGEIPMQRAAVPRHPRGAGRFIMAARAVSAGSRSARRIAGLRRAAIEPNDLGPVPSLPPEHPPSG